MTVAKLASLLLLTLLPLGSGVAAEVNEAPEEIVVVGRLPGPPLWKVSNGDNVLWIFPHLDWIPKGMLWDSGRVERVIAQSQEALSLPVIDVSYPSASGGALNPFNILSSRSRKRLDRYPDGGTLEENLPPELYARYAAVQARYFPGERDYAYMRPWAIAERMMQIVRKEEGLVFGGDVLSTIERLVRRSSDIERTEISVELKVEGSYRDYMDRVEAQQQSFPPDLEHACFEQQISLMEEIDETKRHANSWAEGNIDEFRNNKMYNVSLLGQLPACEELVRGSSSPEQESTALLYAKLKQTWLDAAVNALETNASTFAILQINELVADDGLLNKLEGKGYEVREP